MKNPSRFRPFLAWGACLLGALVLLHSDPAMAAAENLILYTDTQSKALPVTMIEGVPYLPLMELLGTIGKLTVTEQSTSVLQVKVNQHSFLCRPNSTLIMVDRILGSLSDPILMRGATWMVPATFIARNLPRFTLKQVTYREGSLRAFVTTQAPPRVFFDAQKGVFASRVAIEVTRAVSFDVKRDAKQLVVFLGSQALEPASERSSYSDNLIKGIGFDDADARPKIRITLTSPSFEFKTSIMQDGRVLIVSISPPQMAAPARPPATPATALPRTPEQSSSASSPALQLPAKGALRIVTIDAGHGGIDTGARSVDNLALEKNLTLQIALRLRALLQERLGVQVFLTRDKDMDLSLDQRAIIANTDRSDVFISIHVGYSLVQSWSGVRVYVNAPNIDSSVASSSSASGATSSPSGDSSINHVYFRSWGNANAANFQLDESLGEIVQAEMSPLWGQETSAPRIAPLKPLGNVTMPAVMVELGNLNSPTDAQRLLDPQFQASIALALTNAVQQFKSIYEAQRKNEATP